MRIRLAIVYCTSPDGVEMTDIWAWARDSHQHWLGTRLLYRAIVAVSTVNSPIKAAA